MRVLTSCLAAAALLVSLSLVAPPARADAARDALDRLPRLQKLLTAAAWRTVSPGIESLTVAEPQFAELHAYRLSQKTVRMRMLTALGPQGSGADQVGLASKPLLLINGGYFQYGTGRSLEPTGLLVVDGVRLAPRSECRACSGVLYADQNRVQIEFAAKIDLIRGVTAALQVGPMLVHPGGGLGIRSAGGPKAARSAVCLAGDDIIVLAALSPLTLFELARLLQGSPDKGGFGCDRAINLDGGPSTQMYVDLPGHAEMLSLPQPVQNFVAFFAR